MTGKKFTWHFIVLIGHMPAICGEAETIRWMNVTQYLKTRKDKKSKQIVFDGEKLDAAAVLRLRTKYVS